MLLGHTLWKLMDLCRISALDSSFLPMHPQEGGWLHHLDLSHSSVPVGFNSGFLVSTCPCYCRPLLICRGEASPYVCIFSLSFSSYPYSISKLISDIRGGIKIENPKDYVKDNMNLLGALTFLLPKRRPKMWISFWKKYGKPMIH